MIMIPKSSQRWFLSKDEIQQRVSDPFLNNDMEGLRFLVQLFSSGCLYQDYENLQSQQT